MEELLFEYAHAAKGKIAVFLNGTTKVADLIQPMREIRDSLFKHRQDIYELLALWEEYERTGDPVVLDQYYKRAIEVYSNETEILHRLKLEEDYYLFKLTFLSDKAEGYTDYARPRANVYFSFLMIIFLEDSTLTNCHPSARYSSSSSSLTIL